MNTNEEKEMHRQQIISDCQSLIHRTEQLMKFYQLPLIAPRAILNNQVRLIANKFNELVINTTPDCVKPLERSNNERHDKTN